MSVDTVSVIMPTYNCGKYIAEAINSVLVQTYNNWELIIVDDCSNDGTEEQISELLKDKRIRYCRLEKQGGPAVARNRGLELARGDYIAFLDSDDIWAPEKLKLQLEYMMQNKLRLSCTAYELIDENGKELGIKETPPEMAGYRKIFYGGNTIGNSTAMYERAAFPDARVPDIRKRNDFALWLELTRSGERFGGMSHSLAKYRVRSNSVSSSKRSLIKYQWQLYRGIEGHSTAVSCLAFITLAFAKIYKKLKHFLSKTFGKQHKK